MSKRSFSKRLKYTAVYYGVRALIAISRMMPRSWWLALCGRMGGWAYGLARQTRERAMVHLGLAYGHQLTPRAIRNLVHSMFVYIGRNAGDVLRSVGIRTLGEMSRFMTLEGLEHFERAYARGKGVIFISCHMGAFELQVTYMALRGLRPKVIGTGLKDERLNALLWKYRNAFGAEAIARGKETFRLMKTLLSGETVALLIDQDTRVKSVFVDFFGMKAATPAGAAILALKTGAAVIPSFIYLGEDGKQHMCMLPEVPLVNTRDEEADIVTNTQNYTRVIEQIVRTYPEQWMWMHPRWKTRPPATS